MMNICAWDFSFLHTFGTTESFNVRYTVLIDTRFIIKFQTKTQKPSKCTSKLTKIEKNISVFFLLLYPVCFWYCFAQQDTF